MKKIFYFTNIAPSYRETLWRVLLESNEFEFNFFYGKNEGIGIRQIDFNQKQYHPHRKKLHQLTNLWFRKKVLIWQQNVVSVCLSEKFSKAIFLGDMYCISTWIAVFICRLRKKEVIFWGHGIYGNEGRVKLYLRVIFYRLANKHLLYERRGKQKMIENGFKVENLYVVFNSLDYFTHKNLRSAFEKDKKQDVFSFFKNPSLPVLVFIGRLTPVKKLDILIKAHNEINNTGFIMNLVIIGEGPERLKLEKLGQKNLEDGYLFFTGASYDEVKTGKILAASDLCVSPGNVGLTAIHSLSFGTPVCTHDNFNNQMPEAEAISDGINGFFFKEGDVLDLKAKILDWFDKNDNKLVIKTKCYEIIDTCYNPAFQKKVILDVLKNKIDSGQFAGNAVGTIPKQKGR